MRDWQQMLHQEVPRLNIILKESRVGKAVSAARKETEEYETPRLSAKFKVRNGTHQLR